MCAYLVLLTSKPLCNATGKSCSSAQFTHYTSKSCRNGFTSLVFQLLDTCSVWMKVKSRQGLVPDSVLTALMVHMQLALKLLGLEVCADTIVGDQLMRGISGGQKKRVTTGIHTHIPPTAIAWSA